MNLSTLFQIQSTIILMLLFYGTSQNKKRQKHIKIMLAAIFWDILLVLQIEFSREAIATAQKVAQNSWILNIHIFLAVSTVLLYLAMIYLGYSVATGIPWRKIHKKLGITTMIFRVLTYITSFLAV